MKTLCVDIGSFEISRDANNQLEAQSIGGGMVVCFHCPAAEAGGLLNTMFPTSRIHPEMARTQPGAFLDTGILLALKALQAENISPKSLAVYVAGGAGLLGADNPLDLGRRNYAVARRILERIGLDIRGYAVGGKYARDVRMDVASGKVVVESQNGEVVTL